MSINIEGITFGHDPLDLLSERRSQLAETNICSEFTPTRVPKGKADKEERIRSDMSRNQIVTNSECNKCPPPPYSEE